MSRKILIVDDEPDVVVYLTAVLKASGFEPYSADNVETGFELARKIQPHLICLDIMMPRESGISMYTRLKQDSILRLIPVLLLSGAVSEKEFNFGDFIEDKSVPPPDAYLEKPIVVDRYLEVVERLAAMDQSGKGGKATHA